MWNQAHWFLKSWVYRMSWTGDTGDSGFSFAPFHCLVLSSIDTYIVWTKSFFLSYFSMTTFNCLSLLCHSSQRAPFSLVDLTLAWLSLVSSWHLGLMMLLEALEMWGWAKPSRRSCLEWWDTIAHSFSSVLQARPQGGRLQPKLSWPKLLEMISAFLLNESPPLPGITVNLRSFLVTLEILVYSNLNLFPPSASW